MMSYNISDQWQATMIYFSIGQLQFILVYHWSFVLYDVIFIRHYKLLLRCIFVKMSNVERNHVSLEKSNFYYSITDDIPPILICIFLYSSNTLSLFPVLLRNRPISAVLLYTEISCIVSYYVRTIFQKY